MSIFTASGNGQESFRRTLSSLDGVTKTVGFLALGLAISYGLGIVISEPTFDDFWIALGIVVAAPLLAVILVIAGRQALGLAREMIPTLRWYDFIWFLLFSSDMVWMFRTAQETQTNPLDPSAWPRMGAELIIGFTLLFGLVKKHVDWPAGIFTGLPGLITIFCAIGMLSTIWSVYRPVTAYKCLEFEMDVAVLVTILYCVKSVEDYSNFANFNWTLQGLSLAWVWMGMILWPADAFAIPEGSEEQVARLQGVFPVVGFNAVAAMGGVLGLISLARLLPLDKTRKRHNCWYGCILVFGILTLFFAQTRSAMGGFAFAAVIIFLLTGHFWLLMSLGFGSLALLFLTPLGPVAYDYFMRSQNMEQFESLSGRTDWWGYGFEVWKNHPLTGYGMYAAGKYAVLIKTPQGQTPNLHSDWVEIFVGTSVWGLIPILFLVIGAWWFLVRCVFDRESPLAERQLGLEMLAVLAQITVRSFVNVELVWHAPTLFFPVVGYAEYLRRKRKKKLAAERSGYALAAAAP
jgi:hypothetical protein